MSDLFGGLPDGVSLDRQREAVARELNMRVRVYPRWVADGRMTKAKADEEIACMQAVLKTLLDLQVGQPAQVPA